jgi:hypothetical protein
MPHNWLTEGYFGPSGLRLLDAGVMIQIGSRLWMSAAQVAHIRAMSRRLVLN